jgi:hypothetical protein
MFRWLAKDNPELFDEIGDAGATQLLYTLAGYQIKAVEIEPIAPTQHQLPATYIEALEALLVAEKEKEALMRANELLSVTNGLLQDDVETLSEVVDELFDYSSIIRIAKFNEINEKAFNWYNLKAASKVLKVEVKTAPCPRYGKKNLYSHDAWRLAYPDAKLPETTTLVIARKDSRFD